ncbi:FtsB family cell division protein [Saccharicrinis fermentans]|uniref:Septum formation initiator n=1 Tax=Saccharicrinis fermentans DSM 9555 = JCM 21142 TaxID=869213 RepID=W7YAQ8_9BACT|nr:septum formation initiator family protein [Saccharicrinis fermentans]GAF01436.1 septum formation initiator [Saccharicrinis fermentans DSM 9555 = JCM 21142]
MKLPVINLPPLLKNKYILSLVVFGVWVTFFDQNNLWDRAKLSSRINQLEKQKHHYEVEIEQNERKLSEIKESPESLEKFAREQYLMKKKNEDIFVVIEKED